MAPYVSGTSIYLIMKYAITAKQGSFSNPGNGIVFRITPKNNTLILNFLQTEQAK